MRETPKFTQFYKIIEPRPETTQVDDSNNVVGDSSSYSNFSWYQTLVSGSGSRKARYKEYDSMDNDVEVARALDIIAEEMTGNDPNTNDSLWIDVDNPETDPQADRDVMTVKAALQYWCSIQCWDTRLYVVARNLVKYGDYFFMKPALNKKWTPLHPKLVEGAIVDKDDVTQVRGWSIKDNAKADKSSSLYKAVNTGDDRQATRLLSEGSVVHFSLSDDMSDEAPFGESILKCVYRAHKQKELLEDSIIIYRIQRAPERRVFYIDVGKMPPQRVKTYLEQIKNEIKQKKIPTQNGGQDRIDTVYNPQSMSEDFFFAQRSDGKGSRVETLPGGQNLGEIEDLDYFKQKVWRGLRVPQSYMAEGAEGGVVTDGKVGTAYIQELRFALFVKRLQKAIENVLDVEFKRFLKNNKIFVDDSIFTVRLPEPSNFGTYRQQELDAALLNTFTQAEGITYLSKRFIMDRYLGLGEDEIIENEQMLREELGLKGPENDPTILKQIYHSDMMGEEGDMGGGGGLGGSGGLDMGGPPDMEAGAEEGGEEGGEEPL